MRASRSCASKFEAAACATRRASRPASPWPSGCPAESSTRMSQRRSSAETRAASVRSGVINAAVRVGSSSASRRMTAMAVASSRSSAASTRPMPSSATATRAGSSRSCRVFHRCVVSAGRSASETNRSRAASAGGGEPMGCTLARSIPRRTSSSARTACGWLGCPPSPPRHVTLHVVRGRWRWRPRLARRDRDPARAAPPLRRVIERSRRGAPPWRASSR